MRWARQRNPVPSGGGGEGRMKVAVDRTRCESYGFCADAAPAYFRLDDEGDLVIDQDEVAADDVADVLAAVRVCPVAALTVGD
jgi:ferredoxin